MREKVFPLCYKVHVPSQKYHREPLGEDVIQMSEDELAARRALQESLDLRDQGHTDA